MSIFHVHKKGLFPYESKNEADERSKDQYNTDRITCTSLDEALIASFNDTINKEPMKVTYMKEYFEIIA
jgi:hypothetical protein